MSRQEEIEARQLRAKGFPITLLDGREVRISFDLDSLADIEERFGSIGHLNDMLLEIQAIPGEESLHSKFYVPVRDLIRCGLVYDPTLADARIDPVTVTHDFNQAVKAFFLAFPKEQRGATTPPQSSETPATTPVFPGPTSITSSPSSTDEPTPNSGE